MEKSIKRADRNHLSGVLVLALALIAGSLVPTSFAAAQASLGKRYAVIVAGLGGEEEYSERFWQQTSKLYDLLLNEYEYTDSSIYFLAEDPERDPARVDGKATAQEIRRVFGALGSELSRDDQLFIYLTGHGSFDGDWAKFNLVGPDLRDIDFDQLLDGSKAGTVIFVNAASASGPFIQKVSQSGRLVITATRSGQEIYATHFGDFFIDGLLAPDADTDKNGRISMLEAFEYARTEMTKWYDDQRRLRAEHPLLDDTGKGEGSEEPAKTEQIGRWAASLYLEPPSAELQQAVARLQKGTSTPADSLDVRKMLLQKEIDSLKARKNSIPQEEYTRELERLLIELARVNRSLKQAQ